LRRRKTGVYSNVNEDFEDEYNAVIGLCRQALRKNFLDWYKLLIMDLNLKEREKNILAGLTVLLVVFLFFIWVKPNFEKQSELHAEITNLKNLIKNPEIQEGDIEALKSHISTLKKEITDLKYQIPKSEQRGFLIRDLEDLAKKNEIELINFLPKEAVPVTINGLEITDKIKRKVSKDLSTNLSRGEVLRTSINIDSKGKFENYLNFFADIITYYRAVELADIIMSRSEISSSKSSDKRFSGTRKKKLDFDEEKNVLLNVAFTLQAYTSLESDDK
jgi:Tfp pilus assembly protein PilO